MQIDMTVVFNFHHIRFYQDFYSFPSVTLKRNKNTLLLSHASTYTIYHEIYAIFVINPGYINIVLFSCAYSVFIYIYK